MKKILISLLTIMFMSNVAFADCDFSTGATRNDNGTYTYTKECHIAVGQMKYDLGVKDQQIDKLNKALDLKDLAITKADQRADLWQGATFKLEDRINTIDSMRSTNNWISFGIGALTMFAAVYATSQLQHH